MIGLEKLQIYKYFFLHFNNEKLLVRASVSNSEPQLLGAGTYYNIFIF